MRRSKYAAIRTEVDGVVFASKKEARRWQELVLLQRAGHINALECQVSYPLCVTNLETGEVVQVSRYVADFRYWTCKRVPADRDQCIVEDVKGYSKNRVYQLKRKMLKAQYGIEIKET